jgi:hypothetical protein
MNTVNKSKFLVAVVSVFTVGLASAGPRVTVNFTNNTSDDAVYMSGSSSNETTTYANASPKPGNVPAGRSDSFVVTTNSAISYAMVRYQAGSKSCQFTTSYLMSSTTGGVRTPKWNKNAIATGGARCDVRITSVNYFNHDWVVSFTMR